MSVAAISVAHLASVPAHADDHLYRATPVTVRGITTAVAVDAGFQATCAVLRDGTVKCWGVNDHTGYCGPKDESNDTIHDTPVAIPGVSQAIEVRLASVSRGDGGAYAILRDGTVVHWSIGQRGQPCVPATKVIGLSDVVALEPQHSFFDTGVCALLKSGAVTCWDGVPASHAPALVPVPNVATAVRLSRLLFREFGAVLPNATVEVWKLDTSGSTPTVVPSDSPFAVQAASRGASGGGWRVNQASFCKSSE